MFSILLGSDGGLVQARIFSFLDIVRSDISFPILLFLISLISYFMSHQGFTRLSLSCSLMQYHAVSRLHESDLIRRLRVLFLMLAT